MFLSKYTQGINIKVDAYYKTYYYNLRKMYSITHLTSVIFRLVVYIIYNFWNIGIFHNITYLHTMLFD